jgi:G:T-mismatch repair DNA endonuclease (very short patch repair protein)
MADKISPKQRSAVMGSIRSKHARPELFVRKTVFTLGYRWRVMTIWECQLKDIAPLERKLRRFLDEER